MLPVAHQNFHFFMTFSLLNIYDLWNISHSNFKLVFMASEVGIAKFWGFSRKMISWLKCALCLIILKEQMHHKDSKQACAFLWNTEHFNHKACLLGAHNDTSEIVFLAHTLTANSSPVFLWIHRLHMEKDPTPRSCNKSSFSLTARPTLDQINNKKLYSVSTILPFVPYPATITVAWNQPTTNLTFPP